MDKSHQNEELDGYDWKILQIISREGRISITELSNRIGLSKSPCQVRLKRLIDKEYILGFRGILNVEKIDKNNVAFVEVKLSDTTEKALEEFNRSIYEIPEIEQCHMIAGSFDYLIKVRTKSIKSYRKVLGEKISALPYVANTSTHISMDSIKDEYLG